MSQFQAPTFSPTIVSGARTTGDIVSGRIKPDYDGIFSYQPNGNAVSLLLVKARKKRPVTQYQFNVLVKDRYPYRDSVNNAAGYDADDVTIVVANGDRFYARAVVLVPRTMERFLVQSVSSNTLTIEQRGLGNTASPLINGEELIILGDSYPENAAVGTVKSIQERITYNYTQTIRTPFSFSGRDMNTDMFGGPDMTTEEKWQASQHTQKIEHNILWGARATFNDATSGKPNTTMGGAQYWLAGNNEWDLNNVPFTWDNFVEYLEYGMYYGNGGRFGTRTKYFFGSSAYMTQMERWGHDKLRLVPSDDVFGLNIKKLQTTHGDVMLVDHPLFEGQNRDKAFLIDLNHVRFCYHQGRDTHIRRDVGDPGVDGKTHEILSDVSIEFNLPLSSGYIFGLSA